MLDDGQHVGDGGLGRGEPVIEQVDGAAEDDFLGVGDGRAADERAQGHQQGQAAGADLPPQRLRVLAGHLRQRGAQGAGVERRPRIGLGSYTFTLTISGDLEECDGRNDLTIEARDLDVEVGDER